MSSVDPVAIKPCRHGAYNNGSASAVSPFYYGDILIVAVLGYLIFGAFPDAWTWIGAAAVIASGLFLAHRESRRQKRG